MRRIFFPLILGLCVAPAAAKAQAIYNQPPPGAYGGGFIEFMMTGRDPTPGVQTAAPPLRYQPAARAAEPAAPGFYAAAPAPEPYGQPMRGPRVAALPADPAFGEPVGVGRAMNPRLARQSVEWRGPHAPGTVIIDTPSKYLYLVQPGGTAMRYGIGVGRPGFEWSGTKTITMKREWPDWRPPTQMLQRRPDLPRYMAGGPGNPLGARAMYLGSSLYRIHGTNEPHTIGQSVSSGCIRMMNEDVVDLYSRVRVGTRVVVI